MFWLLTWATLASGAESTDWLEGFEARGTAVVEPVVAAQPRAVVLTGATVWSSAGPPLVGGYVVLEGGRISAVGEGAPPDVVGALVIDVTGKHVTPGLIDTHSHLGVYPSPWGAAHADGNEATSPTTAGVWAEHSVWPQDPGLYRALAGGVTTMQVLPGSANLIGGRGVVMRTIPARGSRGMRLAGAPETVKMACGENPKRVYGSRNGAPSTRMGNTRGHRTAFLQAESYERSWDEYAKKLSKHEGKNGEEPDKKGKKKKKGKGDNDKDTPPKPPDRDLDKETLVGVMNGDILPQVHCYRADDMLAMLQVADEFGFSIRSFHHATDAYKIRDILADRGVAASVWADWWGFKLEAYDAVPAGAALVADAGAKAVIHSDSGIGIQRLNQEAAKAWRAGEQIGLGQPPEEALRWVTINPAWAIGVDDQVGSLEPGKRADVVVWDAEPLSVYARPQWVFVDGLLRFDVDQPQVWSDFERGQEVTP